MKLSEQIRAFQRQNGRKGGKARAARLTASERQAIARLGGLARRKPKRETAA